MLGRIPVGGELGVDGRRKGEVRGEPKDNGDGLKGVFEVTMTQVHQWSMVSVKSVYCPIQQGMVSREVCVVQSAIRYLVWVSLSMT